MKAAGVALFVLGYAMLYAGLSNISTGGKGWGFLQAMGFKGKGGVGVNTQAFVQSIVPGGTSNTSGSSGGGSIQQASSPVTRTAPIKSPPVVTAKDLSA